MPITHIDIEGYRSVKSVWLKLRPVNILVGPNGCGKSNLYRSLYLISCAANGQFARAIADEGGMPSVLWAGARGKEPLRMKLGVRIDNIKYTLTCGLVPTTPGDPTAFRLDPDIKEEEIKFNDDGHWIELLKRKGPTITGRDTSGKRVTFPSAVSSSESVLSGLREPHRFPEISALRQSILGWRFYHQFRTDAGSPLRRPQIGVRTPILADDGSDLAAALQTILEVGDAETLHECLENAFPGSSLVIDWEQGEFSTCLQMPGIGRAFTGKELSDGTLQYLCLLAALLSPRPPTLLALNEPETSVFPDLFEPLARLIAEASKYSQLWITTHSRDLADYILEYTGESPIELEKKDGATEVIGATLGGDDDE